MGHILTIDTVADVIHTIKDPIILAGGCFDVLHPGHIRFLTEAKKIGGKLIVLVESDEKIKLLKGNNRPIHSQQDRTYILSHLTMIDYIIPLPFFRSDSEYENLIFSLHPRFFAVTKGDAVITYIKPQAEKINAEIVEVIDRIEDHASTNIIKELNI
ncbi:MAG TPA: adenylyltransferase/cytidyltransferase family protein [Candidatus Levybacteria bacterium]|nr:adenylyltransferase/cytidyltransferase family protein [Candidatus Levybacteria bacterium]